MNRCNDVERLWRSRVRYILESYHYVHTQGRVDNMRRDKVRVFLDSGAFSAMTLGKVIDLDAYCRYCRDNSDIIEVASVLDGIGDAQKTYENQMEMEKQGIKALPCFHYGEDERYLEWYVERYDYITLGGMVPISKPQLRLWLDRVWSEYLCDDTGRPKVKVHGFGMTTWDLMLRYPWFSVDSSSWIQVALMGNLFMPGIGAVAVSDLSPTVKIKGRHITNLSPIHADVIKKKIASMGFDLARLAASYPPRYCFNLGTFTLMNYQLENKPLVFKKEQMELFMPGQL